MKRTLSIMFAILIASCATSFAQSKGYEKSIEANGGVALDKMSKFSFGVSMINGYRINEHLMVICEIVTLCEIHNTPTNLKIGIWIPENLNSSTSIQFVFRTTIRI